MDIYDELLSLIPRKKQTPGGWVSFNAVCCHHNGERRDTKMRAGLIRSNNGGASYHCFNCGFKTGWAPGKPLGMRMKSLLQWLGANDEQIYKISLECLKTEAGEEGESVLAIPQFIPRSLPENSKKITEELVMSDERVHPVVQYLDSRMLSIYDYDFYWSDRPGMIDRMIIPLTVNKQLMGYIARKITDGKPKYITEHPAHIVFNLDKQPWERKFVLVFEGSIDAILMEGVAVLTNEVSPEQALQINSLGKKVIVVPDQDKPGKTLINHALNNEWSVAFPNWNEDIKDAADAVKKYGKLTTLISIVMNVEDNPLKIKLRMKL